ncbi:LETM1-related biofilm-associated protein [Neptunitalea lumnitzerae]|uniref:Letm1 RBD domain-containing protein n=1 Tax=Neptunitalea lumnitzerae TaxID=2965509 RepID=A0ABQ5MLJ8_9FLAO|nr:LETM1-related biofilm-associated protein [Neptunitalea sp. Y10]GLB50227.1 hypothetical protein Y10_25950 [Neptunitalea sp. Y10]
MNPSTSGWIHKFFNSTHEINTIKSISVLDFYEELKSCGFIYGASVHCVNDVFEDAVLSDQEMTKINLFASLFNIYYHKYPSNTVEQFIETSIDFYEVIKADASSFLPDFFGGKKNAAQLEKIIAKRILFDSNILTKNFSSVLTNTLLYTDVLAFKSYLEDPNFSSIEYIRNIETVIENVVITTISSKKHKTSYDKQLLKLLESSLRYHEHYENPKLTYEEHLDLLHNELEKRYLLDITCMTVWDDKNLEISEIDYIKKLGHDLHIANDLINNSILKVYDFFASHKEELKYLSNTNPVKNFYDNSSVMVKKLILRNSKRLLLELSQSKELVILLSQSTARELNTEEKQKVKEQLLDICKAIPSLAIFILPGGSVLLPLLIKFIPKLLPSAFDDNRIR